MLHSLKWPLEKRQKHRTPRRATSTDGGVYKAKFEPDKNFDIMKDMEACHKTSKRTKELPELHKPSRKALSERERGSI